MDMFSMLLGNSMSGGSGSAIQSDYAQNDPNAKDYIKNRPFYSEGEKTETVVNRDIIPLQEVRLRGVDGLPEGILMYQGYTNFTPLVNKGQYNLTIDDTEYLITLIDVSSDGSGQYVAGNLGLVGGDDTGESYCFTIFSTTEAEGFDGEAWQFGIGYQTTEPIHTIGLFYIGDTVPVIAEGTYTFSEEPDSNLSIPTGCTGISFENLLIEKDSIYNISLNGNTYKNLAFVALPKENDSTLEEYYIGNLGFGNGVDTGENYLITYFPSVNWTLIITSLPAGDYTFSLEKVIPTTTVTTEVIHKIDPKFVSQSDYLQNDSKGEGYIKNRPFYSEEVETDKIFQRSYILNSDLVNTRQVSLIQPLSVYQDYILTIDNNQRYVQARQLYIKDDDDGEVHLDWLYFGNPSLVNSDFEDSGEDFLLIFFCDKETGKYYSLIKLRTGEANKTYDVSLSCPENKIVILNPTQFSSAGSIDYDINLASDSRPVLGLLDKIRLFPDDYYNFVITDMQGTEKFSGDITFTYGQSEFPYAIAGNASLMDLGVDTGEKWLLMVTMDRITYYQNNTWMNYSFSLTSHLPASGTIHKLHNKFLDFKNNTTIKRLDNAIIMLNDRGELLDEGLSFIQDTVDANSEQIENLTASIDSLPRQLQEGFIYDDEGNQETLGLSAGTGVATGVCAWVEGSAGAPGRSVGSISGTTLQVETVTSGKITTTRAYLRLQCWDTSGAQTPESISRQISGYEYFKIRFENENKVYFIKKYLVTINSSNNSVEIEFTFLTGNDSFSTDIANNNQRIVELVGYEALGEYSHSEGEGTIAQGNAQHTQGRYNIIDTENKYAHIVGNGTNENARSNAHTVDWNGNGWFAGAVEATGIILPSTTEGSAKRFLITVDDTGVLTATEITE